MSLTDFRTLGRSGLVVSPLALGTMTFGAQGWGSGEDASRAVFDAYVEAGGNFVDTADLYSKGSSEEMLGGFIAERSLRHQLVLATKSGFNREPGNPHAGGNGAKAIHDGVEASLRRLRTDHIDLYWQHVWDMVTPAEEVLETMSNLVRSGKIRYFGLSNVPVWYVAKMATLVTVIAVNSRDDNPITINGNSGLDDTSQIGANRSHINAINGRDVQIAPNATGQTGAHEIGHGLGAGDQYSGGVDASGKTLTTDVPGTQNSIMRDLGGPANSRSVDEMVGSGDKHVVCPPGPFLGCNN